MKYLALLLLVIPTIVYSAVGTITEQEGSSNIQRQKNSLPSTKGASVEMLDIVVTGKGKTSITFVDDTKVSVTENSKLVIDDFVYDPKSKGTGKLAMKVALGTVRYASGAVAHENPNNVKINTPTATIAVRGTDFVMSVDEIGRSIIVLMPQCDDTNLSIEALTCKSGEIEVVTPAGAVVMNKPYQATVVESSGNSPPMPTLIRFDSRQVSNNMQVVPPKTEGGASLVTAARDAIKDAQKSSQEKSAEKNNTPSTGVSGANAEQESQIAQQSTNKVDNQVVKVVPIIQKSVEELTAESTRVTPIYEKQVLTGWKYFGVSDSKGQEANIILPKDSLVQIVVIQDLVMDVFQFANKPQGYITIRQNIK
jgi:hypothetical protein